MQFKSIRTTRPTAPLPAPEGPASAAPEPGAPAAGTQALVEASQNLLKHIPGEASGFYLMAADAIAEPSKKTLGLLFVLALILLIVVRVAAGASRGIMVTTVLAFVIWMFSFDRGFLNVAFPTLLPDPLGLIIAVFYTTLVTVLASTGKIK